MDGNQQQTILRAIAVSSLNLYPQEQGNALKVLEDLKRFDGRIALCISWLTQERHVFAEHDITTPTKLLLLEILNNFLKTGGYSNCDPIDRMTIRSAVLGAAKQYAPASPASAETRILGNKLASLLAGLVVRDFPQRWTGFVGEVLSPMRQGGLWYNDPGAEAVNQTGVRICLECFKLVAEDCTDSDFNAKISTKRRNDILTGLNEVSTEILNLFFHILEHVSFLQQTKTTLHNMRSYLLSSSRGLANMTPEESSAYQTQLNLQTQTGRLLADTLQTMKYFCRSMPLDWMLGSSGTDKNGGVPNGGHNLDFISALLHLLRERTENVQIVAVECLEQLVLRGKLTFSQWLRLISELPAAIGESNQLFQSEFSEHMPVAQAVRSGAAQVAPPNPGEALTLQLDFHRALARLVAALLSSYIAHITQDKQILSGSGPHFDKLNAYLRFVVDMLHHPSGRIVSEQVNTWVALLRDPQVVKAKILRPFTHEVLSCFMDRIVRVRWEDVENQVHPQTSLMEASWDDQEEYDAWMSDFRSRSSLLYRFSANNDPQVAASTIAARVKLVLQAHGNGDPINHVEPSNNQLTTKSDAVMVLEGLCQPVDNILGGLPSWALALNSPATDPERVQIRLAARASLSELAQAVVSWNPSYLWLKFRRATLLEALKHFWQHDPSTLLQGIDSLIRYLSDPDDWKVVEAAGSAGGNKFFSDEIISLKKKCGVALVSVSKKVPHHLVPWLSQLSEATGSLLSSQNLMAVNRLHLYEFLSCVATAVEDPVQRATFIADVLSNSVNALESPELQEQFTSVQSFLSSLGIFGAAQYPESVTDTATVKRVEENFIKMFTSVNQLLSVGKRCNEAARKRLVASGPLPFGGNGGFGGNGDINTHSFPDEGPLSLRDLAVNDPFAPLWPRFLSSMMKLLNAILCAWHPEQQATLLSNRIQKYALAISDDDAYLSQSHNKSAGGVFGEGGTAGSIVAGTDRRDNNLVPKWSGWFNELRHTLFQLLGLMAAERVLYAPEMADMFPHFVGVVVNPMNLKSMEHRHLNTFIKHFVELLLLSCPAPLYATHLSPILGPFVEHMQDRLEKTWLPVIGPSTNVSTKALSSSDCQAAAAIAARGGEEWFLSYYARSGLVVGDLDPVTAEAAVEKGRVEITRSFCDMLQSCLALKGDWALVLAYQAKEEQAGKNNDNSKINAGPRSRPSSGGPINADGTPRSSAQVGLDARKLARINAMPHFLFLENEAIAGNITLAIIQCLAYPDAYTCRRATRICHRLLETVAWAPHYENLLGTRLFTQVVKNIVTEPKWMVGIEWDMINVLRDIYCRLVLGQTLQPGGQGAGQQQNPAPLNPSEFEQAKSVDRPLLGGGILTKPSSLPRHVLASLPGIDMHAIDALERSMKTKRSAKDQKDALRDLLKVAAENLKQIDESRGANGGGSAAAGVFDRAVAEESYLQSAKRMGSQVQDLPEKLVTKSMVEKANRPREEPSAYESGATLFSVQS